MQLKLLIILTINKHKAENIKQQGAVEVQAYLGDIVDTVPDYYSKVIQMNFSFPNV